MRAELMSNALSGTHSWLWTRMRLYSRYFARLRTYALLAGCAVWPEATAAKTSVMRGSRTLTGTAVQPLSGAAKR